jgi:hypothetical protein
MSVCVSCARAAAAVAVSLMVILFFFFFFLFLVISRTVTRTSFLKRQKRVNTNSKQNKHSKHTLSSVTMT